MASAAKRFMSLSFILIVALLNSGYAAPPTAREYVKIYNDFRGFILRDHARAKTQLKNKFTEVALSEDFHGNLSEFYLHTLGQLNEYREHRSGHKMMEDRIVNSTSENCILALHEFVTGKAQQALTAMTLGQHDSEDPLVNSLIQSGLGPQLEDLRARSEVHRNGNESLTSLATAAVTTAVTSVATTALVGVTLYWFGPAYLMVGTENLFPYVWTYLYGPVPAVGTIRYYTLYKPALYNAMGFVYSHSTPILHGAWAVCSAAAYGSCLLAKYGSDLAYSGMLRTYEYFNSTRNEESLRQTNEPDLGLAPAYQ